MINEDINSILSDLREDLNIMAMKEQNPMICAENGIKIIKQYIGEVRSKIIVHQFKDQAEEIQFFKELLPEFYSRLIINQRICYIENNRAKASIKLQRKLFRNEQKEIRLFFEKHTNFLQYYNAGDTYFDHQYFTRNPSERSSPLLLDDYSLALDTSFFTAYSIICSKIKAFEQLRSYISVELDKLDNKELQMGENAIMPHKWQLGPFALVELGYSFYLTGAISGSLKTVMEFLERCFDTKIGNYSRILQQIRIRKGERAKFLTKGIQLLYEHMDMLDEKK